MILYVTIKEYQADKNMKIENVISENVVFKIIHRKS